MPESGRPARLGASVLGASAAVEGSFTVLTRWLGGQCNGVIRRAQLSAEFASGKIAY
jgi:hypothetical protein